MTWSWSRSPSTASRSEAHLTPRHLTGAPGPPPWGHAPRGATHTPSLQAAPQPPSRSSALRPPQSTRQLLQSPGPTSVAAALQAARVSPPGRRPALHTGRLAASLRRRGLRCLSPATGLPASLRSARPGLTSYASLGCRHTPATSSGRRYGGRPRAGQRPSPWRPPALGGGRCHLACRTRLRAFTGCAGGLVRREVSPGSPHRSLHRRTARRARGAARTAQDRGAGPAGRP